MVELKTVSGKQRELLWNIHQKYLHEMTRYYDNEMDENGNYHYGYFDAYFKEPERKAFLIEKDGRLAGFAMINPHSYLNAPVDYVMAEFTVFPGMRKRHVAAQAAQQLFGMFPGRWEIKYHEENAAAKRLWNQVTEPYHPQKHSYSDVETVLSFSTCG